MTGAALTAYHWFCFPGTYVICEVPEIEEGIENPEKQQGEMTHVLYKDQIKHLQEENLWCITTTHPPMMIRVPEA